jgi:hypothetical protein
LFDCPDPGLQAIRSQLSLVFSIRDTGCSLMQAVVWLQEIPVSWPTRSLSDRVTLLLAGTDSAGSDSFTGGHGAAADSVIAPFASCRQRQFAGPAAESRFGC